MRQRSPIERVGVDAPDRQVISLVSIRRGAVTDAGRGVVEDGRSVQDIGDEFAEQLRHRHLKLCGGDLEVFVHVILKVERESLHHVSLPDGYCPRPKGYRFPCQRVSVFLCEAAASLERCIRSLLAASSLPRLRP